MIACRSRDISGGFLRAISAAAVGTPLLAFSIKSLTSSFTGYLLLKPAPFSPGYHLPHKHAHHFHDYQSALRAPAAIGATHAGFGTGHGRRASASADR